MTLTLPQGNSESNDFLTREAGLPWTRMARRGRGGFTGTLAAGAALA